MSQYPLSLDPTELAGKLFCTFTSREDLEEMLATIQRKYTILYGKIFVLESDDSDELICTYNVDSTNLNSNALLDNTILTHRRKETRTLYTINSLNCLIAKLNGGIVDHNFMINWDEYRNCILLTRAGEFCRINTKVHRILDLN